MIKQNFNLSKRFHFAIRLENGGKCITFLGWDGGVERFTLSCIISGIIKITRLKGKKLH